jgi:hypothetical protein
MKNNKLIKYNDNLFIKIFHFFKKLFSRKNISDGKNINEKTITDSKNKVDFLENVKFKENEEEKRLKQLKLQYDNGEIDEDDLTEEEIEKLVTLYEKETEELNVDTAKRKNHIAQMLKELKSS